MAGLDVAAASVKPYPNVEDRKTGCSMIESFLKTEVFRSFCFGTAFSVHRSCSFYSLFILCLFSVYSPFYSIYLVFCIYQNLLLHLFFLLPVKGGNMTFLHPRKMKAALLLLLFCTFLFVLLSIKEREQKTIFVGKAGEKAEWTSPETEQSVIERSTKKKAQKVKEEKRAEKPGEEKQSREKQTEPSITEPDVTEARENVHSAEETGAVAVSKEKKSEGKININRASAEELQKLKGIGPSTAKSIILYREEYGAFSEIEEIMNVKRIGEKTFAKIKEQITVKEEE